MVGWADSSYMNHSGTKDFKAHVWGLEVHALRIAVLPSYHALLGAAIAPAKLLSAHRRRHPKNLSQNLI